MDRLEYRKPNPALSPFVEVLWYYETETVHSSPERVLPHGAFELIITLNQPDE
jgi:hypothetical protein